MLLTVLIVAVINLLIIGYAIYCNVTADDAESKELGAFVVLFGVAVCLIIDFFTGLVLVVLHLMHTHRG